MNDTTTTSPITTMDALADVLTSPDQLQTVHTYGVGNTAVKPEVEIVPITVEMVDRMYDVAAQQGNI